jgi:hypothetical protein
MVTTTRLIGASRYAFPLLIPDLPLSKKRREILLNKAARLPACDCNAEGIQSEDFLLGSKGSLGTLR